jgi:PTS system nitrogen regulatory IIA component
VNLEPFLEASAVVELAGSTAGEVLAELSRPLSAASGLDPSAILGVLEAREALGSTAIGEGCAVPHGRVAGLSRIVASFGRSRTGVDFRASDGRPVRLFFAMLAPESAPGPYLQVLAHVSQLFRSPETREALLAAPGPARLHEILEAAAPGA